MKKTLLLAVIAAALGAGCASTSGTQATTANQTMTLEQALENPPKPARNCWMPSSLIRTPKTRPT